MQNNNNPTPFIDFEDVWKDLKPQLDKEAARRQKRKKRFIMFWFTFIAIAIGGAFFTVNKYQGGSNGKVFVKQLNAKKEAPNNSLQKEFSTQQNIVKEEENIKESLTQTNQQNKSIDGTKEIGGEEITVSKSTLLKSKNNNHSNTNQLAITNEFKASKNKFANAKSYTNISVLKADIFGNENYTQQATAKNSTKENVAELIEQTQTDNELKPQKKTTSLVENKTENKPAKTRPTTKKQQNIFYGLAWNTTIRNGINYIDINAQHNFLTQIIPQVWVAKQLGKKHTILLLLNPYSQYFLSNKAIVNAAQYQVRIYSGSQINTKPEDIIYTETTSFNKLISVEASLTYQYQLSSKIKVGLGISNNWIQGALMQNKVVKNNSIITRDSLYGVDKNDKEWSYIKPSFLQGRLELNYQIKKINIGISFSKPIDNVFNNISQNKTPINTNLFLRWRIK